MAKMTSLYSNQYNKGFAVQTPVKTENDGNGGGHAGKGTVHQRQDFFCSLKIGPLKGTNLRGQTPICGFLRVPAVFCEDLRFPTALFSRKNLRFGPVCPPLGLSP